MRSAQEIITSKTKIVSIMHISNVLGTVNPVQDIARLAHAHHAVMIVDGAQSIAHMPIDVNVLGCDFFVFSSHKVLGPTGLGVLYGRKELLEKMPPFMMGGDMIREVTFDHATWNDLPWKFEAGTPPIAEAVGLSAALFYITNLGIETIHHHERDLTEYAIKRLETIPGLTIYGPKNIEGRSGVISFNLEGIHSHDVATLLDREGIAVRAGHHCAMPLMGVLGIDSCVRASFSVFTTRDDIDCLIQAIHKTIQVFNR